MVGSTGTSTGLVYFVCNNYYFGMPDVYRVCIQWINSISELMKTGTNNIIELLYFIYKDQDNNFIKCNAIDIKVNDDLLLSKE